MTFRTPDERRFLTVLPTSMLQTCYLDVHITSLGVTVWTVVILGLISFFRREKKASSDLVVTVFVSVEVVHRFTFTVRVEVGSVMVTLTSAIPDAIVTGFGVLRAVISRLDSRLSTSEPSHRF